MRLAGTEWGPVSWGRGPQDSEPNRRLWKATSWGCCDTVCFGKATRGALCRPAEWGASGHTTPGAAASLQGPACPLHLVASS